MPPHASAARAARSQHKPSRPTAVGRPSMTMLKRWKRPSRPNTAADRPMRKRTGKIAALRRELAQVWEWLYQTIDFPLVKQLMFAVIGMGMGLSHTQVLVLLVFLLGAKACPSRTTIHRWLQAAGIAAGRGSQATGWLLQAVGAGRLSR